MTLDLRGLSFTDSFKQTRDAIALSRFFKEVKPIKTPRRRDSGVPSGKNYYLIYPPTPLLQKRVQGIPTAKTWGIKNLIKRFLQAENNAILKKKYIHGYFSGMSEGVITGRGGAITIYPGGIRKNHTYFNFIERNLISNII